MDVTTRFLIIILVYGERESKSSSAPLVSVTSVTSGCIRMHPGVTDVTDGAPTES